MGLAWVPDDTGRAVVPASHSVRARRRATWTGGPRHRRPTLLVRGGQAVACRITALARSDPDYHPFAVRAPAPPARPGRPPLLGLAA